MTLSIDLMVILKVLIHSQGNSEGALREAIDHYRPAMVYLLSNPEANAAKIKTWIDEGNQIVGKYSGDVEHCEVINIEPFSQDSVLQMIQAVQEAKKSAAERAGKRTVEYYAGVAGGTKLMVIGMALAAIQGDITVYYVDKPSVSKRSSGEYLYEMTFLNQLMNSLNWINNDKRHLDNLKYLQVISNREQAGLESTAQKIDRNKRGVELSKEEMKLTLRTTDRTITRQLQLLESKGWVSAEGMNPRIWSLEYLGRFILSIYGESNDGSDST